MASRAPVALLAVGALLVIGAAVPTMALGVAQTTPASADSGAGMQLTAYMQSTAAEANASVETGLWMAWMENSSTPVDAVEDRIAALERRLDRVRNRSADVAADRAALPAVVYQARATVVHARIAGLQQAIASAERAAREVGVNASRLQTLRTEARSMRGPAVAAIARNLTSPGPPPWAGGEGPPSEAGPPDDAGPPGNESAPGEGPPDDAGPPGNDSAPGDGPPDDAGPPGEGGNATDPGTGPPTDGPSDDGPPPAERGGDQRTPTRGGPPDDRGADGGPGPGPASDGADGDE